MIKKSFFIIGTLLLVIPFWLALMGLPEVEDIDQINQQMLSSPTAAGDANQFNVFDGSRYAAKAYPWIGYPLSVINEEELLGVGENSQRAPDELQVKEVLLRYQNSRRIVIKIDSWRFNPDLYDENDALPYVEWYLQLIRWAKEVLPGVDVGFYDLPYSPWFALLNNMTLMQEYEHVLSLMEPVIQASDSLYPAFLVQYQQQDSEHLFSSMITHIYIAKRFNKPVYPLISQKGAVKENGGFDLLPLELIQRQCQFLSKYADGLVWWSELNEKWEDSWYDEVKQDCFN